MASATDAVWALMSFELLERPVVDRGWGSEDFEQLLATLWLRTFTDADEQVFLVNHPGGGTV